MDKRYFTTLAFKLFGLYVLLQSAMLFSMALFQVTFSGRGAFLPSSFAPFLLTLGFGLLVWFNAESLAAKAFPEAEEGSTTLDAQGLEVVGITLLGIWVSFRGIFLLPFVVFQLILGYTSSSGVSSTSWISSAAQAVVMIGLGFWVTLNSERIASGIRKLQKLRIKKEQEKNCAEEKS